MWDSGRQRGPKIVKIKLDQVCGVLSIGGHLAPTAPKAPSKDPKDSPKELEMGQDGHKIAQDGFEMFQKQIGDGYKTLPTPRTHPKACMGSLSLDGITSPLFVLELFVGGCHRLSASKRSVCEPACSQANATCASCLSALKPHASRKV